MPTQKVINANEQAANDILLVESEACRNQKSAQHDPGSGVDDQ